MLVLLILFFFILCKVIIFLRVDTYVYMWYMYAVYINIRDLLLRVYFNIELYDEYIINYLQLNNFIATIIIGFLLLVVGILLIYYMLVCVYKIVRAFIHFLHFIFFKKNKMYLRSIILSISSLIVKAVKFIFKSLGSKLLTSFVLNNISFILLIELWFCFRYVILYLYNVLLQLKFKFMKHTKNIYFIIKYIFFVCFINLNFSCNKTLYKYSITYLKQNHNSINKIKEILFNTKLVSNLDPFILYFNERGDNNQVNVDILFQFAYILNIELLHVTLSKKVFLVKEDEFVNLLKNIIINYDLLYNYITNEYSIEIKNRHLLFLNLKKILKKFLKREIYYHDNILYKKLILHICNLFNETSIKNNFDYNKNMHNFVAGKCNLMLNRSRTDLFLIDDYYFLFGIDLSSTFFSIKTFIPLNKYCNNNILPVYSNILYIHFIKNKDLIIYNTFEDKMSNYIYNIYNVCDEKNFNSLAILIILLLNNDRIYYEYCSFTSIINFFYTSSGHKIFPSLYRLVVDVMYSDIRYIV